MTIKTQTNKLLTNFPKFLEISSEFKSNRKADEICLQGSDELQNLQEKFSDEMGLQYTNWANSCWAKTNQLQTLFLCSLCDPEVDNFQNISTNKFVADFQTCDHFISDCMNMISVNIKFVFPYLLAIEKISQCDYNGNLLDEKRHHYTIKEDLIESKDIENCQEFQICEPVCQSSMKLGGELSIDVEGDDEFVIGVYKNSMIFLKEFSELDKVLELVDQKVIEQDSNPNAGKNPLTNDEKEQLEDQIESEVNSVLKGRGLNLKTRILNALGYGRRNLSALPMKASNRTIFDNKTIKDKSSKKMAKFTQKDEEIISPYPGRYMVLISEAEFNKRFHQEVGIPPGGQQVKANKYGRSVFKKKTEDGRILRKDHIKKDFVMDKFKTPQVKMVSKDSPKLDIGRILKKDASARILKLDRNDESKSDTKNDDQLENETRERVLQKEEINSLIEWTGEFDKLISYLKRRVMSIAKGTKMYGIHVVFDMNGYELGKSIDRSNGFGLIDLIGENLKFSERVFLAGKLVRIVISGLIFCGFFGF